ncbi:MAG: hypothetical protein RID07_02300, partial [Lacipirellulaceae bacterium]
WTVSIKKKGPGWPCEGCQPGPYEKEETEVRLATARGGIRERHTPACCASVKARLGLSARGRSVKERLARGRKVRLA